MKIFLSFSSVQRNLAEEVRLALEEYGHDVFYDAAKLQPGGFYNAKIYDAINTSDVMVFLISPESIKRGKYSLTELEMAKRRWPKPSGRVLPVMVKKTNLDEVDPYLKSVTVLIPKGNIAAEIAATLTGWTDPRLEKVRDMIHRKDFDGAYQATRSLLKDDSEAPEPNFYHAVTLLSGRNPRILDSMTIKRVEGHLNKAVRSMTIRSAALRVLAIVKIEYYKRNSIKETSPSSSEILAELKKLRGIRFDRDLVMAITCSELTRLIVDGA